MLAVEIRWSYDHLISTVVFHIVVGQQAAPLYIESVPGESHVS